MVRRQTVFAGLLLAQLAILNSFTSPAMADESSDAQTPPREPTLQEVLQRLNKVEKELLELRIKSGKVPADRQDQRVLSLIETPYLGVFQSGSQNSPRFFAVRLMLVNLTDQPVTLKREDVELSVDGQLQKIKDVPPQFQYLGFQIGQQQVQLRNLQMPAELALPVGGTASTWLTFSELPPGSHVPQLVLKVKLGEAQRDLDVVASQRDALVLKAERIGPRGSLSLLTIAGTLNSVSIGPLVDEIDRAAQDKLVRVVIRFADGSSIVDPQLANWLYQSAINLGRQPQQFNEPRFPALPASLRELHLASVPTVDETRGMQAGYPAFQFQNAGAGAVGRIHKSEAEAVIAALRSAYDVLPREELIQAIQAGSKLERAAALVGGGGRLPADKLNLILKLTDDDDPIIQQAALAALSHFGEPEAIEKLRDVASRNLPELSPTAVASLAGSRYAGAHEALLKLLANEPPESKKNIVRILAAFPRPVWGDAIYEFVKDSRSGLNIEALQALVQVGHPKLLSVLGDALNGRDATLAQTAFSILANRNDRESEELALNYTLEQLKSQPASAQMLQLLSRVKERRAIPLLMAQFDKDQNKSGLIQTLSLLGDAETAKFLADKYPNLQGHEKGEVLRALNHLDRPRFRKLAAQALLTADSSVIHYAVQGLQEDGSPDAIQVMIESLEASGSSYTWSQVCAALANSGTPAARAALVKTRDSGHPEKRNYAVNGLQMLRQRSPGYQYVLQAQNLSREQKWTEAVEQFDMALQLDSGLSDAYADRGHCYLHLEKPEEARKDFVKAWELDPYNSLALTGLCIVLVQVDGKHAEAAKQLEEARNKFEHNALFHYNAACVFGRAVERLQGDSQAADRDELLAKYRKAALADLKASLEAGFQDIEYIRKDADLKSLHELPEFEELLDRPPQAGPPGGGKRSPAARRKR